MYRLNFLFTFIAFFFLISCAKADFPNGNVPLGGMQNEILKYINEYRESKGLKPLQIASELNKEAKMHSVDMATEKVPFGHDGFDERADRLTKSMGSLSSISENVAAGQSSAQEVVAWWLQSPSHKKNIEGDYTFSGIGVAKDKNGVIYYTQIFFKK